MGGKPAKGGVLGLGDLIVRSMTLGVWWDVVRTERQREPFEEEAPAPLVSQSVPVPLSFPTLIIESLIDGLPAVDKIESEQ